MHTRRTSRPSTALTLPIGAENSGIKLAASFALRFILLACKSSSCLPTTSSSLLFSPQRPPPEVDWQATAAAAADSTSWLALAVEHKSISVAIKSKQSTLSAVSLSLLLLFCFSLLLLRAAFECCARAKDILAKFKWAASSWRKIQMERAKLPPVSQ